jgi:hypothetical protein
LLAHGLWFSTDTPVSSTTKTGRHDIAEILLNVALSSINQIKSILRISKPSGNPRWPPLYIEIFGIWGNS